MAAVGAARTTSAGPAGFVDCNVPRTRTLCGRARRSHCQEPRHRRGYRCRGSVGRGGGWAYFVLWTVTKTEVALPARNCR
jgi:hypothetical protein